MIGKQILNYNIISLLGQGGMGEVFLAQHSKINRKVAIKVLKSEFSKNIELRERFLNEASVMAQLNHPSIVSLIDYADNDEGLFLIMEYVEGKTLDVFLKDLNAPLNKDLSISIMLQLLNAFSYAHKKGVIHRDVKPSNIIINEHNEVKVLDFGIAKMMGNSMGQHTKTGAMLGTAFYMSPEQVQAKKLDLRSDIYSLGVTFYELLAGSCPYRKATSDYEVLDKIVNLPLPSLIDTLGDDYSELWNVIKKATEKNPDNRYSTCEDFAKDLHLLSGNLNASSNRDLKNEKSKSDEILSTDASKKRSVPKLILFSIIFIFLLVGVYYFFNSKSTKQPLVELKKTDVIVTVGSIYLRDTTSTDSPSIALLKYGEAIQLLGDSTIIIQEEKFKIVWQKAIWNEKEGWIAVKIDEQPTVGSNTDFEEMQKILNYEYDVEAEYNQTRIWIFPAIRAFLKKQNWIDDFSFMSINKKDYNKDYRTIIKYHSDKKYYKKDDPFDYIVMMKSKKGNKIALFLKAKKDKMGGYVAGYVYLPSTTKFFNFLKYYNYNSDSKINSDDFEIGEIYLVDFNYEIIAILNDENYTVKYLDVYPDDSYINEENSFYNF